MDNKTLEEIARKEMFSALKIQEEIKTEEKQRLVLGKYFTKEEAVFELYIAGEKRKDSKMIREVKVNRITGNTNIKNFDKEKA